MKKQDKQTNKKTANEKSQANKSTNLEVSNETKVSKETKKSNKISLFENIKKYFSDTKMNLAKSLSESKKETKGKEEETLSTRNLLIALAIVLTFGLIYNFKHLFVVASVNGEVISRFTLISELEKQGARQTVDNIVTEKLIMQEAKKKGIVVSDKEVDDQINTIKAELSAQGQTLEELLKAQGTTMEVVRHQVKLQTTLERLLGDKVSVNEEEVTKYYEDNKQYFGEEATLEEVRSVIEDQLKNQKYSEEFAKWLEEVKKNSNIQYFADFTRPLETL